MPPRKPSGRKQARSPKATGHATRWSTHDAWAWREKVGWLVGCNYTPRHAINQLEFWQADTFSPDMIDEELGWAEDLGFNSIRVFLHNLLWDQDAKGFLRRIDQFLGIASRHRIGVVFVLFDGCWDANPALGKQREPRPGVHNSGWVQAPGSDVLLNPQRFVPMRAYVEGVIGRFRIDPRIHAWDLWNEPDNGKLTAADGRELPKGDIIVPFLIKTFAWARTMRPTQPLTGGVHAGDWTTDDQLSPTNYFLLHESDIISYHCYANAKVTKERTVPLRRFERPMLCTEYMARTLDSTFTDCLPLLKKLDVGAYNWGFVVGKTQTHYPWDSWKTPYPPEPPLWFHEVLRPDGTPYREDEVKLIRRLTKRPTAKRTPR